MRWIPALEGVRCLGSGASCGYCQGGQCTASVVPPCADGSCPQRGQCCPDEKRCPDPESSTGWACVDVNACCPDERRCASGCRPKIACCPEERPQCGQCGEICINGTWRCSAQKPCADGSCIAQDTCCPGSEVPCPLAGPCCPTDRYGFDPESGHNTCLGCDRWGCTRFWCD